jgi:hypothetical protein
MELRVHLVVVEAAAGRALLIVLLVLEALLTDLVRATLFQQHLVEVAALLELRLRLAAAVMAELHQRAVILLTVALAALAVVGVRLALLAQVQQQMGRLEQVGNKALRAVVVLEQQLLVVQHTLLGQTLAPDMVQLDKRNFK